MQNCKRYLFIFELLLINKKVEDVWRYDREATRPFY
jgi:hypothetical protein